MLLTAARSKCKPSRIVQRTPSRWTFVRAEDSSQRSTEQQDPYCITYECATSPRHEREHRPNNPVRQVSRLDEPRDPEPWMARISNRFRSTSSSSSCSVSRG